MKSRYQNQSSKSSPTTIMSLRQFQSQLISSFPTFWVKHSYRYLKKNYTYIWNNYYNSSTRVDKFGSWLWKQNLSRGPMANKFYSQEFFNFLKRRKCLIFSPEIAYVPLFKPLCRSVCPSRCWNIRRKAI